MTRIVLGEFSELQYSLSPSYQAARLLVKLRTASFCFLICPYKFFFTLAPPRQLSQTDKKNHFYHRHLNIQRILKYLLFFSDRFHILFTSWFHVPCAFFVCKFALMADFSLHFNSYFKKQAMSHAV